MCIDEYKQDKMADINRWACFLRSWEYERYLRQDHTAEFLRYYRQIDSSLGDVWYEIDKLPERRRDLDGNVISKGLAWTMEEEQAFIDFILLRQQHEDKGEDTGMDNEYVTDL